MLPEPGREVLESAIFRAGAIDRERKSVKNRGLRRTYSANLRIRSCYRSMSPAGVPASAERCSRALREDQGFACWPKESAAAAPCAEQERAKARTGYAPTARCGTGLVRTTGRASALLFDSSLGWLAGGQMRFWLASEARGAGWPAADGALPG